MIKAAFFDIDGTLVSFKTHRMPASTRRALAELHRRGIKCAIATGRSDHKLPEEVTKPFDDFPGFDAFVTFTGSLCYDDQGVYRDTPLARKDVEKIVELVEAGAFEVIMVCRDHDFASRLSPEVLQSGANANIAFEMGDVRQALKEDVYQVNAFVPPEREHEVTDVADGVFTTRWCDLFCDVVPCGGGKPAGIQATLDRWGIDRSEAMAFGDGGNDAAMLGYCGVGVALGGASDEAKGAADYVTSDVDDDGIWNALKHFEVI